MGTAFAEVRSKSDLVGHDGQVVRVIGTYAEHDTRPHGYIMTGPDGKAVQSYTIGVIRLVDRTLIDLDLLPNAETAALDKKMVAIVGLLEAAPAMEPGMAQQVPRPTLHEVQLIELAPA
jgi:hypothetical protein